MMILTGLGYLILFLLAWRGLYIVIFTASRAWHLGKVGVIKAPAVNPHSQVSPGSSETSPTAIGVGDCRIRATDSVTAKRAPAAGRFFAVVIPGKPCQGRFSLKSVVEVAGHGAIRGRRRGQDGAFDVPVGATAE